MLTICHRYGLQVIRPAFLTFPAMMAVGECDSDVGAGVKKEGGRERPPSSVCVLIRL